jgi:haloalkane dehalogenase
MPAAIGDRRKLTPEIHRHYLRPFRTARERYGMWVLAREVLGSSGWYESLWQRREQIREKPALILWGLKDPAFGRDDLERWRNLFSTATVMEFPSAGHFVQEEVGPELVPTIKQFLAEHGV